MTSFLRGVYVQSLAVAASTPDISQTDSDVASFVNAASPYVNLSPGTTLNLAASMPTGPHLLQMSFASVPIVSQLELFREYQELGEALGEIAALEQGDEWWVEPSVLNVAGHLAMELMTSAFAVPQIFSHGSKSIVFNWSLPPDNLYLTVSSDRVSALISSPERIKRRVEYPIDELLNVGRFFLSVQFAYLDQPVTVMVTSAVSESPSVAY